MCCSGEITNCNCAPSIWFNRWANPAHWPSRVGVPHSGHDRGIPCVRHEPVHEHRHFHQLLHQQLYPWDWTWVTAPPAAAWLIQNQLRWILVTVFHLLESKEFLMFFLAVCFCVVQSPFFKNKFHSMYSVFCFLITYCKTAVKMCIFLRCVSKSQSCCRSLRPCPFPAFLRPRSVPAFTEFSLTASICCQN